ncbi:MAG: lysophospholipid acyltransferase family protein, partial [Leptospiraceae bacterium]|nr:lysophospholipid acyltransferase family protein [Leptospiraceae bacterium]
FPFRLRARVLSGFAVFLALIFPAIRRRIQGNLNAIFPDMPTEDVTRLYKHNLRVLRNMINEFCEEPRMTRRFVDRYIVYHPDRETHARLLDRGGILVLGHLGNWETMGVGITHVTENDLYVFSKRHSNPWSNDWVERTRATQNIKLIYTDESPRIALGLLKKGRLVAFISDQDAGKSGEFFPFLGKLASTYQGPALFARMTDVPILFLISYYDEQDRLHFEIEEFQRPNWNSKDDPREWEREFTYRWVKHLENQVRKHPGDYYWLHRRWHTRPENENQIQSHWAELEQKYGPPDHSADRMSGRL